MAATVVAASALSPVLGRAVAAAQDDPTITVRAGRGGADITSPLFATTGHPRLTLITCGGDCNPHAGRYKERLLVNASYVGTV